MKRLAPASPYGVGSLRARAGGGRKAVERNRKPDGGCRLAVEEDERGRGPAGRIVVCSFDPLRIQRQFVRFPLFCVYF